MDEKDKESLKEVCVKYCNDLTTVIKHQLSQQQELSLSTKMTSDQLTETDKGKTQEAESKQETEKFSASLDSKQPSHKEEPTNLEVIN